MKILIVDFGAPGVKKIASFLKSRNIKPIIYKPCDEIIIPKCCGIILSGGPDSVCWKKHLSLKNRNDILVNPHIPILGICYGAQLICKYNGGKMKSFKKMREAFEDIKIDRRYKLFKGFENNDINVFFRHYDCITELPENFIVTSVGEYEGISMIYSFHDKEKNIYAVQYHPELQNEKKKTFDGAIIIENFLKVCEEFQNK